MYEYDSKISLIHCWGCKIPPPIEVDRYELDVQMYSLMKPMLAWSNSLTRGFAESEARDAGNLAESKALKKNKAMKKGVSASGAEVIIKAAEKRYDAERAKYLAALQTFNASGLDASFANSFADDADTEKMADAAELTERSEQHVRFLTLRKEKVSWTSPLPDLVSKVVTTRYYTTGISRTNTQSTQWGVPMPASVLLRSEKGKAVWALTTLKAKLKEAESEVPVYTGYAKRAKQSYMRAHWTDSLTKAKEIVRKNTPIIANVEGYLASPQCRHIALLERTCELTGLIAMLEALVTSAATWAKEQAEMEQFCSTLRTRASALRAYSEESSYSSSDSDEDGMDCNFVKHGHIRRQGEVMPMPT